MSSETIRFNVDLFNFVHKNKFDEFKNLLEMNPSYEINMLVIESILRKHLHTLLKNIVPSRFPVNEVVIMFASEFGDIDSLKYLFSINCPYNICASRVASRNGHLECLKFIATHFQHDRFDEDCMYLASQKNQIDCMKYLHENGCPWHEETYRVAIENNSTECAQYCKENGCPDALKN
jgi:hypothetical protein